MKTWQKLALIVVPAVLIAAFGIWRIHVARTQPGVVPHQAQSRPLTDEEMVQPRKLYIDDLKSARELINKPVWIQAGYEMDYYSYAAHQIDFAHKAGVLPSVERLDIQDILTEKVPATLEDRIAHGDKQAFAVFTMPGSDKEYVTPIGTIQGTDSSYYCDNIFYYDDPHQMYKFWPADVWQAIDAHTPKQGMSELEVAMALGVMQQSESSNYGNRTVTYNAGGKHWSVTFENDKATQVQQQPGTPAA